MTDNYKDAVEALYSPLHQARTSEALKQSALRRTKTVDDMREYLRRVGLTDSVLPTNIVHITGTKGKGSTACMCEAILREQYNLTTGLFTSPHLVDIRERIRVNGKPISQQVFAQAYWTLRRRLEAYEGNNSNELPMLPGYFRMMTLLAFYVFSHYQPQIDVIILEVGMGGRYDATNILDMDRRNVVCGVTLLDFDHMRVLGNTLEEIAWEKGGIFQMHKGSSTNVSKRPIDGNVDSDSLETINVKEGCKKKFFALDTNTESSRAVLRACAAVEGQGQKLYLVSEGQVLPPGMSLGLQGDHQRINAELAIALCKALMKEMQTPPQKDGGFPAMQHALENASWPGRCQSVELTTNDGVTLNLRLDGAHTPKALDACLKWFAAVSGDDSDGVSRVLIFNCGHERNPVELLEQLVACHPPFDTVYFCRADFERPSMVGKSSARELLGAYGIDLEQQNITGEALTWQDTLANVWTHLEERKASSDDKMFAPATTTSSLSVGDAVDRIKDVRGRERIEVLATGSLYIVGSVLDAVEWKEEVAVGALVNR